MIAHERLGIDDMYSIESDDVAYARALFNAPYATVRVRHGIASDVLPALLEEEALANRPWIVWLDYDVEFNQAIAQDVSFVLERCAPGSALLITYNGNENKYGPRRTRPDLLTEFFGAVVPDGIDKRDCQGKNWQELLASYTLGFMEAVVLGGGRVERFTPAFKLIYRDTTPMITVGGLICSEKDSKTVRDVAQSPHWRCMPAEPISAPHLTLREVSVLRAEYPRQEGLSRSDVQALGFDLKEDQIQAFGTYYKEYPNFVQVVA